MPESGNQDKSGSDESDRKKSSGSESSSESNGSESDSSASSVSSKRSVSKSEKSAESNKSEKSESDDGDASSGKRSPKTELKQCWEENPDIYGIRRSGRSKKEPDRLEVKSESERSGKKSSRRDSRSSPTWNSSVSDSDTDKDVKRRPPRSKPPGGRRPARPPAKAVARSAARAAPRKRRYSDSSDDSDYSDTGPRRAVSRRGAAAVSYKEQSEDDKTDSDDVTPVNWDEAAAPVPTEGESTDTADTIEKVLQTRRGKKGATGGPTTFYAVDENGDPNDGCDPDDFENTEVQYLIKWKGWSHIHNTWESQASLKENKVKGFKKLENYISREEDIAAWKRKASPEDKEYFDCQAELHSDLLKSYTNVERVIAQVDKPDGETDFFVKWQSLPYSEASVEDGVIVKKKWGDKVHQFLEREQSKTTPSRSSRVLKYRPKFFPIKSQPSYIGGSQDLQLRDYQLDGLNWLVHSWCKENSCILADEMGLGKTIQTICFLYTLFRQHQLYGPFLLVVPLSTMTSWQRECALWAPEMNFVIYLGDVTSRNIIRDYEWRHAGTKKLKINAVLTTYEIALKDKAFLGCISWAALLVDEAHRLKNDDSLLYKALADFDCNHRLLITGTPLQNSLKELWALLHFIMPQKFTDWEQFEKEHGNSAQKGYTKLHSQLEPFILRRVKKDVEKSLPAKVEQILRVEMCSLQKQYYKWILTKNYSALRKGVKGSTTTFNNIMIELKKCCNHAALTKPPDSESKASDVDALQTLLRGSGKLVLLDKLLVRLKETGHRVLIFSQMVRMLDILAEYLQLRRFQFQRLDGSVKGDIRNQALDHFNAENSQDFCFLLSTRAGGLGINLATADTVVIFDSDWNPQNDLQAQARAHRIGQKNQVNIYRLVTKNSVEEEIIERAKKKMVLDHLVIQRMDTTGRTVLDNKRSTSSTHTPFNKDDLTAILKFGAQDLFKEEDDGDEEPACDIDEILKRAETAEEAPATVGDELLSAFKVASFAAFDAEADLPSSEPQQEEDTKDWDDIIPGNYRKKVEEEERAKEMEDLYLPPRSRKTLKNLQTGQSDSEDGKKSKSKKDDDNSEEGSDEASDEERPRKRGRPKKTSVDCDKPFNDNELRRFIRAYKKFPTPLKRLEAVACEAELQEKPLSDLRKLGEYIERKCQELMADPKPPLKEAANNHNEDSNASGTVKKHRNRGPSFKIGRVSLNAKTLLATLKELEPLDEALPADTSARNKWVLNFPVKSTNFDCPWEVEEDSRLLRGIYQYGLGAWEQIKMDPSLGLADKILLADEKKPQAKHLLTRAEYLLKILRKVVDSKKGVAKTKRTRRKVKEVSKEIVEPHDGSSGEENTVPQAAGVGVTAKKVVKVKSETEDDKEVKKEKKVEKIEKGDRPKKESKKKKVDGPMHFTASSQPRALDVLGELEPAVFNECKEKMRPVKKALKSLDSQDQSLSEAEQVSNTRQCLMQIGDQINKCLAEYKDPDKMKQWRSNLWYFVSKFTEYDAKKLYKLYKHELKKEMDKKGGHAKEDREPKLKDKQKKHKKQQQVGDEEKPKRRHADDSEGPTPPKKPHLDSNSRDRRERSRSHDKDERRQHKDVSQRPSAAYNSSRHDYTAGDGRTTASPHGRSRDRDDRDRNRDRYSGDRDHKRDRFDGGYNRSSISSSNSGHRDRPNPPRRPFHGGGAFGPGFGPPPPYGGMYPMDPNVYMSQPRYPTPYPEYPDYRTPAKDRDYRRPPTNS